MSPGRAQYWETNFIITKLSKGKTFHEQKGKTNTQKKFYRHLIIYVVVNILLIVVDTPWGGGWWFYTRLKSVLLMGGYDHLTYAFNYWGPTGVNRDTFVLVRKLEGEPEF